jgi:hypothetical protein
MTNKFSIYESDGRFFLIYFEGIGKKVFWYGEEILKTNKGFEFAVKNEENPHIINVRGALKNSVLKQIKEKIK